MRFSDSLYIDGFGYSDSAGSDEVPIPCDAVHKGRGDYSRTEYDRVRSPFSLSLRFTFRNSVLAVRRSLPTTE